VILEVSFPGTSKITDNMTMENMLNQQKHQLQRAKIMDFPSKIENVLHLPDQMHACIR
jgi:hypothetical protein